MIGQRVNLKGGCEFHRQCSLKDPGEDVHWKHRRTEGSIDFCMQSIKEGPGLTVGTAPDTISKIKSVDNGTPY
jgi:hypothetical protein